MTGKDCQVFMAQAFFRDGEEQMGWYLLMAATWEGLKVTDQVQRGA